MGSVVVPPIGLRSQGRRPVRASPVGGPAAFPLDGERRLAMGWWGKLFRAPRPARRRAPDEGWYRSGSCRPLTVAQVRQRRFRAVRRGGLDPTEVYAFVHRIAGELAVARRELAYTVEENGRIKRALRSWQSRFAPRVHR